MPIDAIREQPLTTRRIATPTVAPSAKPVEPKEEPSAFARVLAGIGHEADRGERMMRGALGAGKSGDGSDSGTLLALQAGVYRYSEAIDLSAKLVDHAATAAKTIIQGQ